MIFPFGIFGQTPISKTGRSLAFCISIELYVEFYGISESIFWLTDSFILKRKETSDLSCMTRLW